MSVLLHIYTYAGYTTRCRSGLREAYLTRPAGGSMTTAVAPLYEDFLITQRGPEEASVRFLEYHSRGA